MGTPSFAVQTLQNLINNKHNVVAVFTQKPKPKNRGMNIVLSPIHCIAKENNIKVFTPDNLKDEEIYNQIVAIDADCIIVVAYGMIIPQNIIDAKKYGAINLHPSKLPRFRGAAPLQRAIIAGDTETTICTMQMDKGLDTGDILLYKKMHITQRMTFTELHDIAAKIGADLIIKTLDNIETINPMKQSDEDVIYAHKLTKEEGLIDWRIDSAFEIDCKVRGMNPWPGVYFKNNGELIKILKSDYTNEIHDFEPGTILDKDFSIACVKGILTPLIVQRSGKKLISGRDFINGIDVKISR
jgi:methionyl-tRNA formyltransferase